MKQKSTRTPVVNFSSLLPLAAVLLLIIAGGTSFHGKHAFHALSHSSIAAQSEPTPQHSHASQDLPGPDRSQTTDCGGDLLAFDRIEQFNVCNRPVVGDVRVTSVILKNEALPVSPPPKQIPLSEKT